MNRKRSRMVFDEKAQVQLFSAIPPIPPPPHPPHCFFIIILSCITVVLDCVVRSISLVGVTRGLMTPRTSG